MNDRDVSAESPSQPAPPGERASSCCGGSRAKAAPPSVQTPAELLAALAGPLSEDAVVDLLAETHPVYAGLSAAGVVRLRGALLLALGRAGLTESGLPFLLEELQSAHDPSLTGTAAHVLRTAWQPETGLVEPLLSALLYIRFHDDVVAFPAADTPSGAPLRSTAMAEVIAALGWLGAQGASALPRLRALLADAPGPNTSAALQQAIQALEAAPKPATASGCCGSRSSAQPQSPQAATPPPLTAMLQDQDGQTLRFDEYFLGRPTIVVFFYTRCENQTKCPLTIARLGRLQLRLQAEGLGDAVQTAAITYDPEYDLPDRLTQYARSWGAHPGPRNRMLRSVSEHSTLREWFELGVGYGPSLVNRHRLEAYVLDEHGRIHSVLTRLRWSEEDLLTQVRGLLPRTS